MPVNLLNEADLNKYLTSVVYTNNEEVPHWVSDKSSQSQENLQNPDWVKEHKDEVVKAILLQYFKKRIREYFMKSEDVPYLESVKSNEKNLPEWCQKALSENKSVFKFDEKRITSDLKEKIMTIRDYLYAMADKYVVDTAGLAKKTEKISKIHLNFLKTSNQYATFENVLSAAEFWHEKLAISSKKVRKDEEFYKKSLEGTKFIMELPNNTFAYQLLTPNALDFEGDNMGHCVGRGYYDDALKKGTTKIYSIRDENGESHVTFEVRKDDDGKEAVYQCKGKQNKAPVQKYMDVVQAFIEKMDLDIEGDFRNIGLLKLRVKIDEEKFESKFYSIQSLIDRTVKIPDGTVCDGDINFDGLGLKVLPDLSNLVVKGRFDCSYNKLTSLEGAPEKVGGDFNCSGNQLTSLEGAPKEVGGHFNCRNNQLTSLEGAPEKVGGNFYCSDNILTSLEGAPEKVGEHFICSDNQLTSLEGAPKEVGGGFNCSDNQLTSLEWAPKEVGGSFYCSDNQLTSLEGAPEKVGGNFYCVGNQLTSLEGAPEKVGGSFYCGNNQLTSLEGAPKKIGGRFDYSGNPIGKKLGIYSFLNNSNGN